ncbi:hypothetical protein [Streptomyces sp. 6-11-2]|uniref:hypothetical protein n=1 Tax=Streptomyces sp. 6-11-2 TaxID=2585753 RepID=UPI00114381E2|nr:hypothetical protein [Streptomyces sp. 6-11-2]GED90110.1 hypothetical protein TNCT6_71950 [Streptomyces sp. 6-11-2]
MSEASGERGIKTKVVRVALEELVARSQPQRTKQGTSAFTPPTSQEPTTTTQTEKRPEDADR